MLTSNALTMWLAYRGQLRKLGLVATSTITNQSLIVLRLKEKLGDIELDQLRKSSIEIYAGERLATCAPITVRGELNVLSQALNWCVDEGHLVARPKMPTVKGSKPEAALPPDEAFLWHLANLPTGTARALEMMMLTGLSPHELERVEVRDVVLPAAWLVPKGTIIIGGRQCGRTPKLGIGQRPDFAVKQEVRRRWVPLNGRAMQLWFEATAGMQPTTRPFPSVEAMQTAMRREVQALSEGPALANSRLFHVEPPAGIGLITPKMGRQWFASKSAQKDVPENVLQRLLGHAPGSPITRRHYIRSSDEQLQNAVDGMGL